MILNCTAIRVNDRDWVVIKVHRHVYGPGSGEVSIASGSSGSYKMMVLPFLVVTNLPLILVIVMLPGIDIPPPLLKPDGPAPAMPPPLGVLLPPPAPPKPPTLTPPPPPGGHGEAILNGVDVGLTGWQPTEPWI